jgi:hypothetical protein
MRGYEVVTSDDRRVGHVVDVRDGYLIVESGHMRKSRHPVPREFVHIVDEAAKAFVTVPRRVLMDAPDVDRKGNFDHRKAAFHFGLADSFAELPSGGQGESLGHDPTYGAEADSLATRRDASEHRRAEIRKHLRPGYADEHRHHSTALFGDRRISTRRAKTQD